MHNPASLRLLLALCLGPAVLPAATPAPSGAPAAKMNPPNVIAAPAPTRPLKIAIFEGPGSGEKGIKNVSERARQLPGATVTALTPEEVGTRDLKEFDVIVFSGGSGSAQSKAIGEAGRKNVRQFVEQGGGYLGICAGAYLACAGFDWGLGILNAKTKSSKWRRGSGMLATELTDSGREIFGAAGAPFVIRYNNGPIIEPLGRKDLPAYQVGAVFREEVAKNDTPKGIMLGSPAIVYAPFGKGRVLTLSPHSEDTPGLENMIPRALAWLGTK